MHVYKLDPEIALIIRPSIADQTGTRGKSHPRCLLFARIAAIRQVRSFDTLLLSSRFEPQRGQGSRHETPSFTQDGILHLSHQVPSARISIRVSMRNNAPLAGYQPASTAPRHGRIAVRNGNQRMPFI
jgi:hypothetical protein